MPTLVDEKTLKMIVRSEVREVLGQEFARIRALAVPDASPAEQRDIEKRYGRPSRRAVASFLISVR